MIFSGWYETENGANHFYIEGVKTVKQGVDHMRLRDPDFGHTDMEVDFNEKDVTKQVYEYK